MRRCWCAEVCTCDRTATSPNGCTQTCVSEWFVASHTRFRSCLGTSRYSRSDGRDGLTRGCVRARCSVRTERRRVESRGEKRARERTADGARSHVPKYLPACARRIMLMIEVTSFLIAIRMRHPMARPGVRLASEVQVAVVQVASQRSSTKQSGLRRDETR